MNDDDLRDALRHHTGDLDPEPPPWDTIARRAVATRRRSAATRLSAAAVVVVVLAAGLAVLRRDDDGSRVRAADSPTATVARETTTTTAPVVLPPPPNLTPVPPDPPVEEGTWPFATRAQLDAYDQSGSTAYDSPVTTTRAFATDYLGMPDPVVSDKVSLRSPYAATVTLRPNPRAGLTTVVSLLRLRQTGAWTVTGATTANIEVDRPSSASGAVVPSPLEVAGRAQAFEGTVHVEVRADGMKAALGAGTVTGRSDAMGPFTGSIPYDRPATASGAVLFEELSAEDGSPLNATVVRIRFTAR